MQYLNHIKQIWHKLLHKDKQTLQKVNQITIKALKLKVSKSSRCNVKVIQDQLLSDQIFGMFNQQNCKVIWSELFFIKELISTLYSCFENIKYLQNFVNCIKWLIKLSFRDTVFTVMKQSFFDMNQMSNQCLLQKADSTLMFMIISGNAEDQFDLDYWQI